MVKSGLYSRIRSSRKMETDRPSRNDVRKYPIGLKKTTAERNWSAQSKQRPKETHRAKQNDGRKKTTGQIWNTAERNRLAQSKWRSKETDGPNQNDGWKKLIGPVETTSEIEWQAHFNDGQKKLIDWFEGKPKETDRPRLNDRRNYVSEQLEWRSDGNPPISNMPPMNNFVLS